MQGWRKKNLQAVSIVPPLSKFCPSAKNIFFNWTHKDGVRHVSYVCPISACVRHLLDMQTRTKLVCPCFLRSNRAREANLNEFCLLCSYFWQLHDNSLLFLQLLFPFCLASNIQDELFVIHLSYQLNKIIWWQILAYELEIW